jgi:tetratricopeptide (TPR) repeat protein
MLCKKLTYYLLFGVIFIAPNVIYSQDPVRIDSLENALKSGKKKERFDLLTALSVELARVDYTRSQELADEAITLARKKRNFRLEVSGYINKGYCHELNYEDSIAETLFREALKISEENNYDEGVAESLYRIGRSYSYQKDYTLSGEFLDSALLLSRKTASLKTEGQVLSSIADNLRQSGKINEALDLYRQALETARKAGDYNTMGTVFSSIGSIYYSMGDYRNAVSSYEESRKLRILQANRLRIAQTENNIANCYFNLARYDMAIEYYQKALPVFEELKYSTGIASIYNGMAVIYFEQKLYDKSLENHLKKLEISKATGNLREVGNTLNNIGNVYEKMTFDSLSEILGEEYQNIVIRDKSGTYLNSYSRAFDYYDQALQIRNELNDPSGLLATLGNIGLTYLHSGKLDVAMEYLDRAKGLSQEINNTAELARTLMRIGQVYDYKGQYDMAIHYLDQSRQYAVRTDLKAVLQEIYITMSNIFEKKKEYNQALAYYKLFSDMKDSISKKETLNMMAEMQVKFETENLTKANELLVVKSQLNEARMKQQKILILLFMILLGLVSSLVVFLFIRNYRKRKELLPEDTENLSLSVWMKKISLKLTRIFHWII